MKKFETVTYVVDVTYVDEMLFSKVVRYFPFKMFSGSKALIWFCATKPNTANWSFKIQKYKQWKKISLSPFWKTFDKNQNINYNIKMRISKKTFSVDILKN